MNGMPEGMRAVSEAAVMGKGGVSKAQVSEAW
jgi:hypothetical protein